MFVLKSGFLPQGLVLSSSHSWALDSTWADASAAGAPGGKKPWKVTI